MGFAPKNHLHRKVKFRKKMLHTEAKWSLPALWRLPLNVIPRADRRQNINSNTGGKKKHK
ncbi:rCG46426 [Rattus norvegicus]|uniref:RCG46426 n=1 Tax=Rattus norvegicus TaxID=10116 RepID=A6IDG0_RAT|nr:rCG46426 [Rattus norvegicus]